MSKLKVTHFSTIPHSCVLTCCAAAAAQGLGGVLSGVSAARAASVDDSWWGLKVDSLGAVVE